MPAGIGQNRVGPLIDHGWRQETTSEHFWPVVETSNSRFDLNTLC